MEDEFDKKFNEIISNSGDFHPHAVEGVTIGMSVQELAELLESLNVASAVLAQNIFEALEDRENYEFPEEAVALVRTLRPMCEALAELLSDECDCELEEDDEEDDTDD